MHFKKCYLLATSFLMIFMAGCIQESLMNIDPEMTGEATDVKIYNLSFETTQIETSDDTRSVDAGYVEEGNNDNPSVKDVWLIEYGKDGIMVGNPMYYETSDGLSSLDVPLVVPTDDSDGYTLVAIANTHSAELKTTLLQKNLYSSICEFTQEYYGEESGYVTDGETHDLLMNGNLVLKNSSDMNEGGVHTGKLQLKLKRNMAKLTVKVKMKYDSGIEINSLQLMSVSNNFHYVETLNNGLTATDGINLPVEKLSAANKTDKDGFIEYNYYIPANKKGTNNSQYEECKNINAPLNATYIELKAEDKTNKKFLRYKVYVGKNMKNDFNIESNHHYILTINIDNPYNSNDSRIELSDYDMAEEANCYIVNYKQAKVLTIPIDRINKFWGNVNLKYPDSNRIVKNDTEWTADVIWQDSEKDLFYFCDVTGKKIDKTPHFYNGTGLHPFSICPTGEGSGNVLIGVRRRGADPDKDGYMWSWHIWFTDYNPDNCLEPLTNDKDIFKAEGGHVHRYNTDYWQNTNKIGYGIYMMDRNFGAEKAELKDPYDGKLDPYRGLYYYFGRKDPFPWSGTKIYRYEITYGVDGAAIGENRIEDAKTKKFISGRISECTVENTVKHPNVHYYDQFLGSWTAEVVTTDNIYDWNDGRMSGMKHLFDPAPLGWRLPVVEEIMAQDMFDKELRYYTSGKNEAKIQGFFYKLRTGSLNETGEPEFSESFFPISGVMRGSADGDYLNAWTGFDGLSCALILTKSNMTVWKISTEPYGILTTNNTYIRLCVPTRMVRDPKTIK